MAFVLSICGVVFVLMGMIMYFFPPKKINGWYGYRTGKSMENQEIWDYAQKYGAKALMILGLIYFAIDALFLFLFLKYEWILDDFAMPILLITVFAMIVFVENRLKRFKKTKEE